MLSQTSNNIGLSQNLPSESNKSLPQIIRTYLIGIFGIALLGLILNLLLILLDYIRFKLAGSVESLSGLGVIVLMPIIIGVVIGVTYIIYKLTGKRSVFLYLAYLYFIWPYIEYAFPNADYFTAKVIYNLPVVLSFQKTLSYIALSATIFLLPFALIKLLEAITSLRQNAQQGKRLLTVYGMGILIILGLFIGSNAISSNIPTEKEKEQNTFRIPNNDRIVAKFSESVSNQDPAERCKKQIIYCPKSPDRSYQFSISYPGLPNDTELLGANPDTVTVTPISDKEDRSVKNVCGSTAKLLDTIANNEYKKLTDGTLFSMATTTINDGPPPEFTGTTYKQTDYPAGSNKGYIYCFVNGSFKYELTRFVYYRETIQETRPIEEVITAFIQGKKLIYGCLRDPAGGAPLALCTEQESADYGNILQSSPSRLE